jgi:catechol 2,3-dioxygenase-like lactoylglutathione lyase family enzyme
MKLGAFSVSLAVKNIEKSKDFYQKLGFSEFGGDQSQNWLIMKNGDHIIGLFQEVFPSNILTFNPGWNQDAQAIDGFDDVRTIHKSLVEQGIEIADASIVGDSGPSNFSVIDPDGNMILIDQHI